MPDLVVENLAVRLADIEILKKVSFTAVPGEIIALLGPSGSGKTTLLRCVAGLERPYQGKITIGERTLLDAERGIELAAEQRGLGRRSSPTRYGRIRRSSKTLPMPFDCAGGRQPRSIGG